MRNFHFRLEPLLNKERIYESECVGRLMTIHNVYVSEKDKLERLNKHKIICQDELKSRTQGVVFPDELRAYEEYFLKLASDTNAVNLRLREVEKELETVQDELGKIVKKRKALEKLRDRWEDEYKSYLTSASNKEMDEIAMTKFTNKLMGGND